ncbi:MAG: hypothetical protein IKW48_09195 [Akkermansia sp.]|nr:hypothetical protein [Akkermansia sp.]
MTTIIPRQSTFLRSIAAVSALSILTASVPSCSSMSDSLRTQIEAGVTGAFAGAAVGALIGYLIKKNSKGTLIGVLIGTGSGLLTGTFYGYKVAKTKEAYARTEDYIQANIAAIDSQINSANLYNTQLQTAIELLQATKVKIPAIQQPRLQKELQDNLSLLDQHINSAQIATQSADGESAAKLREKIKALKNERKKLSQASADLNNYI